MALSFSTTPGRGTLSATNFGAITPAMEASTFSAAMQSHAPPETGRSKPLRTPDEEIADYLAQLDLLRQDSERKGDFLKAQQCVNRMREVNLRYAKRIEQTAHQANKDARERLAEEHKLEIATFTRMWEDKLTEYDLNAEKVISEMKAKHIEDYARQEGILKVQIMNRRPRFSKTVMDLRDALERMIQQRQYLEAEELKQKLAAQERFELESFDDGLAGVFEKRTQTLKVQYVNEMRAVEQKIKMGREELLSQRKIDFERLLKRHANVIKELDQETKLHISKTRQYVLRQVKALVHDPVKTGVDLRGVERTVRDGQGKKLGYGNARQRAVTPPASARRPESRAAGDASHPSPSVRRVDHSSFADTSYYSTASSRPDLDERRFGW